MATLDDPWVSVQRIAEYIGLTEPRVRDAIVTHPKFPKPARPAGGHPRWRLSEVDAWMVSQQS